MKKRKKTKIKLQKKDSTPIQIKKTTNVHKLNSSKKKSTKKFNFNVVKTKPIRMLAKDKNLIKAAMENKNKKTPNNKKQTSIPVLILATVIGIVLAGIVIFMFVKVHSYREKRVIADAVLQFQEEDPSAFIAANNDYIFWVKDKSVKLKNTEGKVLWEIPILADEYTVIHEAPNLLITYDIDGAKRIERYNNSGELESILIADKVIDIKINKIGEVLVLTEEVGNVYSLKVFNIAGELKKEIIRLNATEVGFPTGIAISPNGTKAAISIVNTASPIITSNVSIIDVEMGKTIEGTTFRDEIAYDVIFLNEREWNILKH